MRSRHRALILGIVVLVAAAAGARWLWAYNSGSGRVVTGLGGCDATVYPPPTSSTTGAPSTTTTTPSSSTSLTSNTSTTSSTEVLHEGDQGPAVMALQRRLSDLGYWLGDIDGRYGSSTVHAVIAFQKAQGMARDGTAGPATVDALSRAPRPQPRSHSGRLIEIDLSRQLLLVVADGRVDWAMDACTGARPGSTPIGVFHVFRQVDGYDRSPLGVLYRPKYFNNGVAVHGYPVVPPRPASHGCVRVTNAEMDWLWSQNAMPVGTEVRVY